MQNVIQVEHMSKAYGKLRAIDDISFEVQKGMVFGLLGANGAGKSTTIECILGTKSMDVGTVRILGHDPVTSRKQSFLAHKTTRKTSLFEQIGVQFQEAHYQENIRVDELCESIASLYKKPANYHELLSRFGIEDKKKSLVKELSGGQKQRLFVILALLPNPEVVFLDELTTGLDTKARRDVWKILKELKRQGLTIFLTSHYMEEVEELCDKICILKQGSIVFCGTVKEAIEHSPCDKFVDAYLWFSGEEESNNESF